MKIQVGQLKIRLNWIRKIGYLVFIVFFSCENDKTTKRIEAIEEGKIKCEYSIENNQRNGKYQCFFENGNLKEDGNYKDDKKNGVILDYYENGNIKSKSEYKGGVMDGSYQSYYDNGKIYGQVFYSNGIRKGYYERFDSINQNIMLRVEYIKTPKEQIGYKFGDYVNRVWTYIDGDTNFVSVDSDVYSIKNNTDGITIKCHFSDNSSNEGIDRIILLIGESGKQDTIDLHYNGQKRVDYDYKYKPKDIEKGWVRGVIIGTDVYNKKIKEDSSVLFSENRRLYFNWSIKDKKVINF